MTDQVLWSAKDPQERLDYGVEFADRLDQGDTISEVEWGDSVPSGLIRDNETVSGTLVSAYFSGGAASTYYRVPLKVTAAPSGRIYQRDCILPVQDL